MAKLKDKKLLAVIALFIAVVCAAIGAFFLSEKNVQTAQAVTITKSELPNELQQLFTDYTMTALSEEYNSSEKLNALKNELGNGSKYKDFFDRAEKVLHGEVMYQALREFSTENDALNPIDQFGDLYEYQDTLKWRWPGCDTQVTGIYGISNETFTVYVEADANANLPGLVFAQSQGTYQTWRESAKLSRGINTFKFPFGGYTNGDKGGVVYLSNPYTKENQGGNVRIYIDGGGFYPVYEKGDDENVFIEQVKEFHAQRQQNPSIPDIAELLPDHALFTVTETSVYEEYVINHISPAENLEYWSDYLTKTFEFNGMTIDDPIRPVQPYVRISVRGMYSIAGAGAYAANYHIGFFRGEQNWLANYKNTTLDEYYRFGLCHEIGHVLDVPGRTLTETTNNVSAVYSYFIVLGKSMNSNYLPFSRAQSHIFSDYTLDYLAFDDGRILYFGDNNYDHNYLMWWCLESVFPGYWGKLNNCYRNETAPSTMNTNERMVYYSSLVTGVDLSEYFERWGLYLGSKSQMFKIATASEAFKTSMKEAKDKKSIKDDYASFWYADVKQYDFTREHLSVAEKARAYSGKPSIITATKNGNSRTLTFSPQTDFNLLGYEILSSTDGVNYKVAGFTYTNSFTDSYNYTAEPFYKVRGVNRFFSVSGESVSVKAPYESSSDDKTDNNVCRIEQHYYKGLAEAVAAAKNGDTIYLLDSFSASNVTINKKLTIAVADELDHDITINNSGTGFIFTTNGDVTIKGRENARIVIDGLGQTFSNYAINASNEILTLSYVTIKNYSSKLGCGGVSSVYANLNMSSCVFENCSGPTAGAIATGIFGGAVLKDCIFTDNHKNGGTSYKGAVYITSNANNPTPDYKIENCTFQNNEQNDIFWTGNLTFVGNIPKALINCDEFEGERTIALDGVETVDPTNLSFVDKQYGAKYTNGSLVVARIAIRLTFISDGRTLTEVLDTYDFVFGQESLDAWLDEDTYFYEFKNTDTGAVYRPGDKINIYDDATFQVSIVRYASVNLISLEGNERTVKLKAWEGFYLPRFDSVGHEIVAWASRNGQYWAGTEKNFSEDITLYAIYAGQFCYAFMDGDELVSFDYAVYGKSVSLPDSQNVIAWLAGDALYLCGTQYTITAHTVFYAVHEGEKIYDLTLSEIELETNYNFVYDGKAKTPQITVKINGEALSSEYYDVTYTNNSKAGTATITITGKGNYKGTNTKTFEIKKAAKPENTPAAVVVPDDAVTLNDIELPDGWKWLEPETELGNGTINATAQYLGEDKDNYETTQVTVELSTDPEHKNEAENNLNGDDKPTILVATLIVVGIILTVGAVAGVTIFVIRRRRK